MKYLIFLSLTISTVFASNSYKRGVAPVTNELYKTECSSCHMAYQPGLLPEKSWWKIMSNLDNHFGVDASLDDNDLQTLKNYIYKNSAEKHTNYKRSRKIINSLGQNFIPDAISQIPYIIRKHHEIRKSTYKRKEIRGLFNCSACHTTFKKGIYNERGVRIPGIKRWY
jgi:protein-arginine kinase activator protein McsA